MTTRPAAVAGAFYPADEATLRADVKAMLSHADQVAAAGTFDADAAGRDGTRPRALIVPHAGYVYSGPIAASAYRLLNASAGTPKRVLLLGPAHRVYVEGVAIPSDDRFATPFGDVAVDTSALAELERLPCVQRSDEAHEQEHCLEVQLPFLQLTLRDFSLVPVVVGQCASADLAEVIDTIWQDDGTLVVVSSDLSHYLPHADAVRVDTATSRAIVARSEALDGSQACGAHAINGLMHVARRRHLEVVELDLRNSGDTAGDQRQVVGYGSYALY